MYDRSTYNPNKNNQEAKKPGSKLDFLHVLKACTFCTIWRAYEAHKISGVTFTQKIEIGTTITISQKNCIRTTKERIFRTTMIDTIPSKKVKSLERNRTRSYKRYRKYDKAIKEASDNGRCWWIEKFLRHTIKY